MVRQRLIEGVTEIPDLVPAAEEVRNCAVRLLDDGAGSELPPLTGTTEQGVVVRVASLRGMGSPDAYQYQAERILPVLRGQPHYRGGLWLLDETAGLRRNFSFWTDEAALREATERIYAGYRTAGRPMPVEEEVIYAVHETL